MNLCTCYKLSHHLEFTKLSLNLLLKCHCWLVIFKLKNMLQNWKKEFIDVALHCLSIRIKQNKGKISNYIAFIKFLVRDFYIFGAQFGLKKWLVKFSWKIYILTKVETLHIIIIIKPPAAVLYLKMCINANVKLNYKDTQFWWSSLDFLCKFFVTFFKKKIFVKDKYEYIIELHTQ